MIPIPIWLFVLLIATNTFTILALVVLINAICYLHDMAKVSIDLRREKNGNKAK